MGLEIDREQFSDADFAAFSEQLERNLRALRLLLRRPGFGRGPLRIGAELELNLVDAKGQPCPINHQVLDDAPDSRISHEINRFNLEINARPVPLAGSSLSAMQRELAEALAGTRRAAALHGARIVAIGILPTLTEADLSSHMLSDSVRYRALAAGIARLKGEPFRVQISGQDELSLSAPDVTFEGANTSFQIHLDVAPERFADVYNAAQLATAPALAVACNSPSFLGRRLWQETRVALFRQAVDDRADASEDDWRPARVSFGHGWVRRGAFELFAELVAQHQPLLPVSSGEEPEAVCSAGGVPELAELRLHCGTVWRWNRPVYAASGAGQLRLELRALPAGPTATDMVANLAFLVGLTLGLAPHMSDHTARITFGQARRNFYEAARVGLDAELLWPAERAPSPRSLTVQQALPELLRLAREGLVREGEVDPAEADAWLSIIRERAARGLTPAGWQRQLYEQLARRMPAPQAWATLLEHYLEQSVAERPLHTWPDPAVLARR
jgi:hypothetical protein